MDRVYTTRKCEPARARANSQAEEMTASSMRGRHTRTAGGWRATKGSNRAKLVETTKRTSVRQSLPHPFVLLSLYHAPDHIPAKSLFPFLRPAQTSRVRNNDSRRHTTEENRKSPRVTEK